MICAETGKEIYTSRANANAHANQIVRRAMRDKRGQSVISPYRCPSCGRWHLGHQPMSRNRSRGKTVLVHASTRKEP